MKTFHGFIDEFEVFLFSQVRSINGIFDSNLFIQITGLLPIKLKPFN